MVRPPVDWEGLSVFLLAILVYINTLGHDFVYDDNRAILGNPDVLVSSPLDHVFQNDFWGTPLSSSNSHGSFRPITVLSFRLNHWASGLQPFGFHLTNVLLHGIATALVLKTARVLLSGKSPTLAAAIFAVHPIHVEAVTGIVGRADILALIFFLISLLFYVKHINIRDNFFLLANSTVKKDIVLKNKTIKKFSVPRRTVNALLLFQKDGFHLKDFQKLNLFPDRGKVYFILYLVFAVCAVLCKEPGVTVIPLAISYDVILHLRSKRLAKLKTCITASVSASLVCFVSILLARLYVMGLRTPSFSKADNPTAKDESFFTRTYTFLYLPIFNFLLLMFPRWLSFDWSMDAIPRVTSMFDYRFLLTAVVYFFLIRTTKTALSLNKFQKTKHFIKHQNCKICNFNSGDEHSTSCRVVNNNNLPLQCSCHSPPHRPLPSGSAVTMCLAFLVIPFIPASNLFFYVGFVVAERVLYIPSVGFCFLVALGVQSLWSRYKVLAIGGSLLLLAALGSRTLQRNQDWSSEEALYRSATPINPPKAFGNLGSVLSTAGRLDEAEEALRTALKHRPNMADVHYNLGNLLSRQLKYQEAVASYQLAIQYRPSLAVAHLNLGHVLEILDRWQDAEQAYRKCWQLDVTGLKDPKTHEDARTSCLNRLNGVCSHSACSAESLKIFSKQYRRGTKTCSEMNAGCGGNAPVEFHSVNINGQISTNNKTRTSGEEDLYLRAVSKSPADPAVYLNYGQLLVRLGRHAEAAAMYVKAAQLAPHQHTLVTSAAIALRQAGQLKEAEALYRQARDLRPLDATSHSNLGAIFHLQGNYQQAATSYKEALRLSPGDQVTLTNLQKLRNLLARNKR